VVVVPETIPKERLAKAKPLLVPTLASKRLVQAIG